MNPLADLVQKALAIQREMAVIKGQIKFFNKMLTLFKVAEAKYPNVNNDANFDSFLDFMAATLDQECERLAKATIAIKAEDQSAVENYLKEKK